MDVRGANQAQRSVSVLGFSIAYRSDPQPVQVSVGHHRLEQSADQVCNLPAVLLSTGAAVGEQLAADKIPEDHAAQVSTRGR
ncbi:hypothetical protein [Streptomyces sp. NPDC048436]|uniref:hypothetical protein n=1 Tax=Streptomyces sp. NPDC048436 TaxID=3365550 RepID=UPI00370FA3D8